MTPPRRSSVIAAARRAPARCSPRARRPDADEAPVVRIAFFQDLSVPDHVDLVSPSFLAFDTRPAATSGRGSGIDGGGRAARHGRRRGHRARDGPRGGGRPLVRARGHRAVLARARRGRARARRGRRADDQPVARERVAVADLGATAGGGPRSSGAGSCPTARPRPRCWPTSRPTLGGRRGAAGLPRARRQRVRPRTDRAASAPTLGDWPATSIDGVRPRGRRRGGARGRLPRGRLGRLRAGGRDRSRGRCATPGPRAGGRSTSRATP